MSLPDQSRIAPDALAASNRIDVILVKIELAAKDTNLYTFRREDDAVLPPAEPGAHIGLFLANGMERQYSLVIADPNPRAYTIGVKRDAASRGGSRFVHDELRVGTRLSIAPPRNNFILDESAAVTLLFAGGIGITPIYCMFRRLRTLGREAALHYANRSRGETAFLRDLRDEPGVSFHFDEEENGRFLPIGDLVRDAPADAHLYCCGPMPMLAAFEKATEGRAAAQVHIEYFTPKFEAAVAGGFIVELARTKQEFFIAEGRSILDVLREAGVDVSYSCEQGICGSCETRVLSGEPDHRDSILSEGERAAGQSMMICCSGAKSERLVLDL